MRVFLVLILIFSMQSCWDKIRPIRIANYKVAGFKPVYSSIITAKQVAYIDSALPVIMPGNIYVKGDYLYQLEVGKGIHIIDNRISSSAHRIGFITVNGSSQISIKGNHLFTNSYDDLLVLDISDLSNISEIKRVTAAFPEGRHFYFYIQPLESGYYECPQYDSVVVGWKKDSVSINSCFKQ